MTKFKNIHSETGRFTYNGMRIAFNGEIETKDKGLIDFLSSNSSFKIVKSNEDAKPVDPIEITESVESNKDVKPVDPIEITESVESNKDVKPVDLIEIAESVELENIELAAQDKKSLVALAESLAIETKGLNKEQIIQEIEKSKLDL